LGLSLVKKHVDRLRGRITFDSDSDGSTFRLTLPRN
jgi:signal transduction histidine kinase